MTDSRRRARAIGVNHVALEVGDIDEALEFYGALFDFELRGRSDDMAFVSDVDAGKIYQVVKDGKWLSKPVEFVSGLVGPQGMTLGIHNDLIVMEKTDDPYNGRMLSIDLDSKEITVLADALGVDPSVETRNWKVLKPHSTVAQTLDGTIYFTEPGATSFSVLRPQN